MGKRGGVGHSLSGPPLSPAMSYIKNVEKEITQIFENAKEMKEGQIKTKKQLAELTEAIDFISNKFDEYKKERKEKEEIIKALEDSLSNMSKREDSLSGQIDKQEQYLRRNCLLLHGIAENRNEKTDDLHIATINKQLELSITEADIKSTNRIGKSRDVGQKLRPAIVKFVRYNDRKNVTEKKLKGKNIAITESLTAIRMKKLNKGREIYDFKNVCTSDGKILFKDESGNISLFFDYSRSTHYPVFKPMGVKADF